MQRFSALGMPLHLFLLGLVFPFPLLSQHPPEEDQNQQGIPVAQLEELTLVNLAETYHSLPSRNSVGGQRRSKLTLKVGIRLKNTSKDYVMSLDPNCFRMLSKLVFRESLVGSIQTPYEFSSTPDGSVGRCQKFGPRKMVRVMPGKSYQVATELEFDVFDDVLAERPDSLNPGPYSVQIRMEVSRGWDFHEGKRWSSSNVWWEGPMDSELMKFMVKYEAKQRRA